ncbi:ComEA family DNA-binding protein [Alkalimarinus coralli]|uniref:ComEA family DNA-binding protein n=1 Tax=Alkalimarinus coralli TaxID=2935863 RepID=UPI00202B0849|nr:helix-hairpin-helix domain-containing protein [Alkalimarinus coralli]
MFFLTFLLMGAAVWLLWNICKNTGDALDKQTAIQYELVSLEKKLEELSEKLESSSAGASVVKKTNAPVSASSAGTGAVDKQASSDTVNINTANLKEMTQLPRIGKALAQRIIDGRPYSNIEDIKRVQGISLDMFDGIKASITTG